ncbi:MAG: 2-oxoacid:acceptor oxidoreductase family protein [Candidatus Latescibacteria bacterium]|nr:2-oxoacid:acceptor oxidoreductase family protein [Candidatus Latescibacterota bacterium]
MERTEVRIAGFGGQGVVLAGVLLGRAALEDGRYAVQTQSYGAEARGGAARSEVIITDQPALYPEVVAPHVMVVLSQAALDRYLGDLRPEGLLIADAELVTRLPDRPGGLVLHERFTEVAGKELGRSIVANMVMLGFLVQATGLVGLDSLRAAVKKGVPPGTEPLNLKAVERGIELAAGQRSWTQSAAGAYSPAGRV